MSKIPVWASTELPFGELFLEPSRNGLTRPSGVRGEGIKMVNMGELFAYDFITDQQMERVLLSAREKEQFLLKEGDLLFARQSLTVAGTGKSVYVGHHTQPITFESHLIRCRLNPEIADSLFYYYCMRSPYMKKRIASQVSKVAAAGLKSSDLAKIKVPCPDIFVQKRISKTLYSFDKKIQQNKDIINSIERHAQMLFGYWFLQFDFPDENGKPYRSSGGKMVWNEQLKRVIPLGWRVATLADIAQYSSSSNINGAELYINTDNMLPDKRGIEFAKTDIPSTGVKRAEVGDTLVANIRPYLKKIWMADRPCAVSNDVLVFKASENARALLFSILYDDNYFAYVMEKKTGTRMPRGDKDLILKYPFVLPAEKGERDKLFSLHYNTVMPMCQQVALLRRENNLLAAQRDYLLPLLMSGQIKVSE